MLACLVVLGAPAARADGTYARDKRVAHLAAAIDGMTAMGDAGRRAFEIAIYDAVRAKCRPGNRAAPIACLVAAARDVCAGTVASGANAGTADAAKAIASAGDRCLAVADVIVTNQHAEKSMLDEATRMRLVRESADYHLAVIDAMEARWAVLAAELALVAPEGTMAERIDQVCRERDREVRPCSVAEGNGMTANSGGVPVCVGTIAYQRCAAGLVWFTSGPRSKR
ncbi:MAG: hypothetical protein AB7T06_15385 [Kofleriaceae bacterium]